MEVRVKVKVKKQQKKQCQVVIFRNQNPLSLSFGFCPSPTHNRWHRQGMVATSLHPPIHCIGKRLCYISYLLFIHLSPMAGSYGWIGWLGIGIKFSKPFVCKHIATRIRIWRGCPAGGRFPPGECFLALGFALSPVASSLQSRQCPQPDPRTLDEYTPRPYWSDNFIYQRSQ